MRRCSVSRLMSVQESQSSPRELHVTAQHKPRWMFSSNYMNPIWALFLLWALNVLTTVRSEPCHDNWGMSFCSKGSCDWLDAEEHTEELFMGFAIGWHSFFCRLTSGNGKFSNALHCQRCCFFFSNVFFFPHRYALEQWGSLECTRWLKILCLIEVHAEPEQTARLPPTP